MRSKLRDENEACYFRKQTKSIKRIWQSPVLKYECTLPKDPWWSIKKERDNIPR